MNVNNQKKYILRFEPTGILKTVFIFIYFFNILIVHLK